MFSDFTLMHLAKEKQKGCEERGARMRLVMQASGKPGLECMLCQRLGALLLRVGQKLKAVSEIKSSNDLPENEALWHTMFENRPPDSYYA